MMRFEKIITHKIEAQTIQMPKDDEVVVFKFAPGTPRAVIQQFEQAIVEMQNSERKFITTNVEVSFIKTKKNKLEIYDGENTSSESRRHKSTKRQGQNSK